MTKTPARSSTKEFRILVVEDHEAFRKLFSLAVNCRPGLEVCATADSGQAALDLIPEHLPNLDLVVVDLWMPMMNGFELITQIRERWPNLRCAVVSAHRDATYAQQALDLGAHGYIVKGAPKEIIAGVECIASGGRFVSPGILSEPD